MTIRNLEFAFSPASIAIVGASPRPGSIGNIVTRNVTAAGFRGAIHPVNPKHAEIEGRPCFADAASLPGGADLVVIATPPETVPGIVADFGKHGSRAAVVITAGFGSGPDSLRQKLLDSARPNMLRVFGPNCLGLLVPGIGLDASFSHAAPEAGDIALLSQSGAVLTTVIDWAKARNIGFSAMVSLGDMADVDFGDLLDWFAADIHTRAILLYVEAITHPKKFMSAARAAARTKPVIVIKAGRHAEAAKAAASHTGALAGVDEVYDAAFRRAGLLRVLDLNELFDAVETLGRIKPFRGDRLSVLTNGGGVGVLAVDRLIDLGGCLAPLEPETLEALDKARPQTWSKANPVDIIGDAGPERYCAALSALLADRTTDAVLVMNCPTALSSGSEAARAVAREVAEFHASRWPRKPVFAAWLGGPSTDEARQVFEPAGIPSFATPTEAVRGFMHLVRYSAGRETLMRTPPSLPREFTPDMESARRIAARAVSEGREWLTAPEIAALFDAYDIPIAAARAAGTPEEAREIAARLLDGHEAVVVKIMSPDIQHKTDVNGVRLELASPEEAEAAARSVMEAAARMRPQARIDGVTVEPMVERKGARELILGVVDDELFGPVILFGQGGTAVEVIRDKALALPPLDLALARDLIAQTRVSRLLEAFRAEPAADVDAVALTLVKLSQLSADVAEIRELDMNPMLADADGVIAVDARVRVAEEPARDRHGLNPRFAIRPYPAEWDRTVALADGSQVRLRPVKPEDEALYEAFFARVAPEDLRLRFFTPKPDLSHRFLARLTQIDYGRAMAFVALDMEDGALLGVVRLHSDPDGERAEYAVMVRSDLKGQGLGWMLMQQMIAYARKVRLREIHGDVLLENATMLAMCRDLGFAEMRDSDDPGLARVVLALDDDAVPA
jgi:acetyltransferase